MDLQDMADTLGDITRDVRSDYHLTLGKLISALEKADPSAMVVFDWNAKSPNYPNSYRGYYSDLSFHWKDEPVTVAEFLGVCREALGQIFGGYKGGDFVMDANTPLWAAGYGDCGRAIVAITGENPLALITKEID